ncbi:PREDICTED: regulation of enolase protein 1-like [Papilio xuthus]|uniref:Regulation of enolase protein 1-like n=1 Tax=Papilio xuthus TaxID=66420 RepID=A0AAJ7EIG9_PAPXU|nr:PREDICTED: regulation of enolase protein 1-like [Papilio xuthus]
MSLTKFTWKDFSWLNEPRKWKTTIDILEISTNYESDFWQETFYNFHHNTGHLFGINVKENITMQVCVEANFEELYDQAGVMIYSDEKHWFKAGIEFNDGQPMIASVLTNELSDWATGIFTGNPGKFWMRITRVDHVICVKYSADKIVWHLLRLCPYPEADKYFIGVFSCSPKRENFKVTFSELDFSVPQEDILHSN